MKDLLHETVLIKKELLDILEQCNRPMNVREIVMLFAKLHQDITDDVIKRELLNLKLDCKILMNENWEFFLSTP